MTEKQEKPQKVPTKKVLVFMATSRRELVEPGGAVLVQLRRALEDVIRHSLVPRRVEVHVLVHGFQIDVDEALHSVRYTFEVEPAGTGKGELKWEWAPKDNDVSLTYVPGDASVVTEWINDVLPLDTGRQRTHEIDSSMLVFWGHGLGVGTRLTLPTRLRGGGVNDTGAVEAPGMLNIGGLREGPLAEQLSASLPVADRPPIDLLVFDSCLMAGAELAYEFRNLASYLVASQSLVEVAPGGPPGLNVGSVVSAFLQEDAWTDPVRQKRAGPSVEFQRRILEAALDVVALIGDGNSGARQLTLFDLERARGDAPQEIANAMTWLEEQRSGAPSLKESGAALEQRIGASDERQALKLSGLFWLFTRLLDEAASDPVMRPQLLTAARSASFGRVRQFIDLRDLAQKVHEIPRSPLLQLVALALRNELTPYRGNFVVAHRAALPLQERLNLGGVSVYLPWFRAGRGRADDPVFNVMLEQGDYSSLSLVRGTDWAKFAFGPLFEATAGERQSSVPAAATAPDPEGLALLARLLERAPCRCEGDGEDGLRPVPLRALETKPSGQSLIDKPSRDALVG